MSITPRGMSIQEAYRLYRDDYFLVNRQYQRKLVWTIQEKALLIDSILEGYPIPLILLAERSKAHESGKYEIIDGMQRLNAIFSFIENVFSLADNRYFDVREFARAKQAAEAGSFQIADQDKQYLLPHECANILDYQLAVTIYPTSGEHETTKVFGRINSSGRLLSFQERRQAGVITPFAELIRKLAAKLRGDDSKEILLLTQMPEISIESRRSPQQYGITAEDTLWCKQGIISILQLRGSEDEEILADIASSILLKGPTEKSRESLDALYITNKEEFKQIETALAAYTTDRLSNEILATFSVLQETIEAYDTKPYCLRRVVNPGSTSIKTPFYAIFMAFFTLIINEQRLPDNPGEIMNALKDISKKLKPSRNRLTKKDREQNIDIVYGLIQRYFVKKDPPIFHHGTQLAIDFENSLRRSRVETPRYEFKQGLLRLSPKREFDNPLISRIIQTICALANVGPDADGYLYVGVADSLEDAEKIKQLDGIEYYEVAGRYVVGIDREARTMGISLENYVDRLLNPIRTSQLTEPLKSQLLSNFDIVNFRGFSVIRLRVPMQKGVSFVGDTAFTRDGSSTVEVQGQRLVAISYLFK